MANYCPNCGSAVGGGAYCPVCGASLSTSSAGYSTASSVLGTLMTVSLIGGLTRRLYYYGGRYYLDPHCRNPFLSPHMIIGRPRPFGPRIPMGPRPPMPPRPPMGPRPGGFGGPRGGRSGR